MAGAQVEVTSPRTVVVDGRELLSFAGCNYLGLAHHPAVLGAARETLERVGVGALASRTTSGNHAAHDALERELAAFLGVEAVLLCADGYLADLAALQALAPHHGMVLLDSEAHPALRDSALATGLLTVEYPVADVARVAESLVAHAGRAPLVLTDGVYPTDGRLPPVAAFLRHLPETGALVVDDSHALGVLGPRGGGTLDAFGSVDGLESVADRLVVTSSLAKALGCAGGIVAGCAEVVAAARLAPAFVAATPIPPAIAAAALAAVRVLASEPERVARLRARAGTLHAIGADCGASARSAAVPFVTLATDSLEHAAALSDALAREGIFAPRFDYPGAPPGLRLTVTSEHTDDDLARLGSALPAAYSACSRPPPG